MLGHDRAHPLRILLAIESAGGGAGRHVIDLGAGLVRRGHSVTLVYSPDRADTSFVERAEEAGLQSIAIRMARLPSPWSDLRAVFQLSSVIREHGPFDVVHGHSSKAGALLRLVPPQGAARVYTPHAFRTMDPYLSRMGQWFYQQVEGFLGRFRSDAVIAVGSDEMFHARTFGLPNAKLRTVVNGIGTRAENDRVAVRQALGLPDQAFVAGFVGRLTFQKAPERFVRALALLARDHEHVHGLMVGSGDEQDQVRSLIQELGLAERITLVEEANAQQLMPAMDVLVMPSRYESMPYVLIEALTEGLPIVATAVGGTRETVIPTENGFICPQDDDGVRIAAQVGRLVADPVLRSRMSAVSSEMARNFSAERMVRDTEAIYYSLLRPRPGKRKLQVRPAA